MVNILYVSAHPTLEYDEITKFLELGFNVFSIGHYLDFKNPVGATRGPILNYTSDKNLLDLFKKENPNYNPTMYEFKVSKEFINNFDIIIVVYSLEFLLLNWEVLRNKIVIRRTIAQSNGPYEASSLPLRKDGLKIARYSYKESTLPGYVGGDGVVRTSTNPEIYQGWNGKLEKVLTIQKSMKIHATSTQFEVYNYVTYPFNRSLYGFHNEDIPWAITNKTTPELQQELKDSRCYYCTCTRPTSYTYSFQEAFMTGCPIVTVGPKIGNNSHPSEGRMYDQHDFIENGKDGFWSDDLKELRYYIEMLLKDYTLAAKISENGRQKSLKFFHPEVIKSEWRSFFNNLNIPI